MTQVVLDDVATLADRILSEVERAIVGKREVLELVLLGVLADGHILLEDVPGLAKTLIARRAVTQSPRARLVAAAARSACRSRAGRRVKPRALRSRSPS